MPKPSKQAQLPGMEWDELSDGPTDNFPSKNPEDTSKEALSTDPTEPQAPSIGSTAQADSVGVSALVPTNHEAQDEWTCYVVDSHSLIYQVFHALPEMSSPHGEPVGALYGFLRDIVSLLETHQPDALICAFDLPGPTFRHELYDQYKADRDSMPEELASQLPKIRESLAAMGIPIVEKSGYEADDLLATLARLCDEREGRCLLVTGDKDCRQLITPRVAVYNIRKDSIYDAESLLADWGVRPDQVIDFQALVGDKVDNVPGVPLIGPKIAQELLTHYGCLDDILERAQEIKQTKRRENLLEFREQALLSRRLVALDPHVPIDPDWNAARPGSMDHPRLAQMFAQFGFRSLAERVAALDQQTVSPSPTSTTTAHYTLVDTAEKFQQLTHQLGQLAAQHTLLSIDTETTSLSPRSAKIVGYALAWQPGLTWESDPREQPACLQPQGLSDSQPIETFYVPVRGPQEDRVLDHELVRQTLQPFLEDPHLPKIGQNLKYDQVVLRNAGIQLAGVVFDTMVASYLLDAGQRSHNLDQLAQRYLGHTTTKIDSLIGKGKDQLRMDQVAVDQVGPYAAEDAEIPLRLFPLLSTGLAQQGLATLNASVEVPLIGVLADMEYLGVSIDIHRLQQLSGQYHEKLTQLTTEIEKLAGHPLNIASPKQLSKLLFNELKLPVLKKNKTGPSTDASVLAELADMHPLPAKIVLHRQFAKLLNTYVDALPELVHPSTGRVHAALNQVVAATGRLSSSNPNLQNIPVRTLEGREIRSAFRARGTHARGTGNNRTEPWKLLAADYSQIELRVLAHLSGDQTLTSAFAAGEDIHTLVASQVEGVPLDQVDRDMRRRAKGVNFGILYGQSPFGLAKALGIAQEEAAQFIETYFARYPDVQAFLATTLNQCRMQGFVTTLLGRRRSIQGVRSVPADFRDPKTGNLRQLNLPERTAVNTVIQGSAADLIKLAMIGVHHRLSQEKFPANMILQIHDELLLEVDPTSIDPLARMVSHEMSQVMQLNVPLSVDIKWGDNWADCEQWEE